MFAKNLSFQEITKFKEAVAILPTGALEQHGPYLPLGTDAIIAEAVAMAVESKLPKQTVVYPTLVYGCSKEHKNFKGTVYLEFETYTRLLHDVLRSIFAAGFSKVLIIGGHGGNHLITQVIQADWNYDHPNQKVYYQFAFTNNAEEMGKKLFGSMESHAGSVETSIIYALSDDYKKTGKRNVLNKAFLRKPGTSFSTHTSDQMGILGVVAKDPKLIFDPQMGERVFKTMVADLHKEVIRILSL